MTVSIVFGRRKNPLMFLSSIIRWAEGIGYSHCSIIVETKDNVSVFESVWPKAHEVPLWYWKRKYEIIEKYSHKVEDPFMQEEVLNWLNSMKGKKYSLLQLVGIGLAMISAPLSKIIVKAKWNGSRFLICTEMAGNFLERFFGYKFPIATDLLKLFDLKLVVEKLFKKAD